MTLENEHLKGSFKNTDSFTKTQNAPVLAKHSHMYSNIYIYIQMFLLMHLPDKTLAFATTTIMHLISDCLMKKKEERTLYTENINYW